MTKKILLGFFALAVAFQAGAQDKAFNFGFKVAPSIAWLNIDSQSFESDGSAAKCNWGLIGAWNFSENFSLVSGFNVNYLGGGYKHLLTKETNKIRLREFEIPAALQAKTGDISDFKFYAQFGLATGYIFKGKDKDGEKLKHFNHVNASFFAVAGAEYAVTGGISLIGQLKYCGGMTSVMDKSDFAPTRANFIELGLGVMF